MTQEFSSQDITRFLSDYIAIGDTHEVNDHFLIVSKANDEVVNLKTAEGVAKPLAIYSTELETTDAIIVNPFAEGMTASAEINWFYMSRSMIMSQIIKFIMYGLIQHALPSADDSLTKDLTAKQLKLVAAYADRVDEKMLVELKKITKNLINFFNIYYQQDAAQVVVRSGILEDSFREGFAKQVRQKTWDIFKEMITKLLGTDDPKKDLTGKIKQIGYGRFKLYSELYAKVLTSLQPYWHFCGLSPVDLKSFKAHVEMIPLYYTRAKHLSTPIVTETKAAPTRTSAPWVGTPAMLSAMAPSGGVPTTEDIGRPVLTPTPIAPQQPPQSQPTLVSPNTNTAQAPLARSSFSNFSGFQAPLAQTSQQGRFCSATRGRLVVPQMGGSRFGGGGGQSIVTCNQGQSADFSRYSSPNSGPPLTADGRPVISYTGMGIPVTADDNSGDDPYRPKF